MRIPDFESVNSTDLSNEVKFFQANTDGLVIDIMRNPGGSGCTVEQVMSYLNPGGFHSVGNKIRATWDMVMGLESDLEEAQSSGATENEIAALQQFLDQLKRAFAENRGFTTPLPLCGPSMDIAPAHDRAGNEITYSKPILVLADELSASAAEVFAAVMQDEKRATIYGARTDGAGGAVVQYPVGVYMESYLNYAKSILTRKNVIDSGGQFPNAPYIENIGVLPDVADDYMTISNLLDQGKPFVGRFTQALLGRIQ
jgi:C-terminal processing protease CtpA/Prc